MHDEAEAASKIYHVAGVENLESILEHGVQPQPSHRAALEDDLAGIAAASDIDLPVDRSECVFFYPTLAAATELMQIGGDVSPLLSQREAIVVIEGSQISNHLYVGEFELISDAIDLQHMDEPDAAITAASYEDALRRYAVTLKQLSSFETLTQAVSEFETPEIVVEGGVNPELIVEWRLLRQIRDGHDSPK